jgi:hypothetical protein
MHLQQQQLEMNSQWILCTKNLKLQIQYYLYQFDLYIFMCAGGGVGKP